MSFSKGVFSVVLEGDSNEALWKILDTLESVAEDNTGGDFVRFVSVFKEVTEE